MRSPLLPIRAIQLEGELLRTSVPTIRANAGPRLAGNFFSVDLDGARAAFETVPWVRRAVVRRVWPDRLLVRLEEHHAAALWQGEDGAGERCGSSPSASTSGGPSTPVEASAPSTHRATTTSMQPTRRSNPHGSRPVKSTAGARLESADRSARTSATSS